MTRRVRIWLGIALGVAVLAAVAALLVVRMMNAPRFEPGTVGARVAQERERFDPPPQPGNGALWQVTPDISLHHTSTGSGDDVLLVHGGPGYPPREDWRATAILARSYRVHAYDQRGCGRSTRPFTAALEGSFYDKLRAVETRLGLAAQIADIERIRLILGRDRLIVVGHSFGALIAALYAAEFPDRVRALVLVAPAPLVVMPTEGADLFALVRRRLPESRLPDYDRYLSGYFDFQALLGRDEASLSRYFGEFREFYAAATGTSAAANDGDAGGFMTLGVYASLGRSHDWRPALQRVRAPTLVLHGANDLQPESDTRAVAAAIPGARVEVIAASGHFLPDDAPEAFAEAVRSFLEQAP
jgi:proline iminopeptidase